MSRICHFLDVYVHERAANTQLILLLSPYIVIHTISLAVDVYVHERAAFLCQLTVLVLALQAVMPTLFGGFALLFVLCAIQAAWL